MGQDSAADLDIISANNRGDVEGCCSSMFSLWLRRQTEASWKQLIDALIKVKLNVLASEIEKSLISEKQHSYQEGLTERTYLLISVIHMGDSVIVYIH